MRLELESIWAFPQGHWGVMVGSEQGRDKSGLLFPRTLLALMCRMAGSQTGW